MAKNRVDGWNEPAWADVWPHLDNWFKSAHIQKRKEWAMQRWYELLALRWHKPGTHTPL